MEGKKISIIVPIYNVEQYLRRCVESLINQTYKNIEIILVDDGSSDGCPVLCDEYARQDNRVVVIHKENGGLSDARNEGLRIATGEYVMYVDSDDYIEVDSCERLTESCIDDVDVVIGVCKEIRKSSIVLQQHTNLEEKKVYEAREYVFRAIEKNEWYAPAWLNMYRRMFLIEHNLFFKVGYIFEDIEMLPRLFLENPKIVYVNYPFYNYVIRENSIMTSRITEEKVRMAIDIYSEWYELFSTLCDEEYQNKLFGVLIKYYLTTAKKLKIKEWKIDGVNFSFAMKYAKNCREKLKVVLYNFFPNVYIRM